jgi:hypothetical protein
VKNTNFIQTCCQILRLNNNFRIHQINTTATEEARGYLALTITVIRRLLESLGTEAGQPGECPRPTHNVSSLEAHIRSLEHLRESAEGLTEALQGGFNMGTKIAHFNVTKNMEDYRVILDPSCYGGQMEQRH